jgi:hypothetical protein
MWPEIPIDAQFLAARLFVVVISAQVLAAVATSKPGLKLVLWYISGVISLVDAVSGPATMCVPSDAMMEQTVAYACPSAK